MEGMLQFRFMNRDHTANYMVCEKDYPTYIYITLRDEKLIRRFGEDVCIHTDGSKLIADNVFTDTRRDLFNNIFDELRKQVPLRTNLPEQQIHV